MKKSLLLCLAIPFLLFALACSDDDAGNDPALRGLWNGFINFGDGPQYTEIQVNSSTVEIYAYNSDSYDDYMELSGMTMKGTYTTDAANYIFTLTHGYEDNTNTWIPLPAQDPMYETYTITGTGVGAVLALVQTNYGFPITEYFTNMAAYTFDDTLAGTWSGSIYTNNMTVYITNVIQANGSINRKQYIADDGLAAVGAPWSCFLQEEANGTVAHNADKSFLLITETWYRTITNMYPAATPAYGSGTVFKRMRIPMEISGSDMVVETPIGMITLTKN